MKRPHTVNCNYWQCLAVATEACHTCLLFNLLTSAWCVLCALLLFDFFWTQVRQRDYLNSQKMNLPKQLKRTTLAAPRVWPEFHNGWNSFLFPFIDSWRTPNACFHSAVWKYQAQAPLDISSIIRVNHNQGESLFHVRLIIENVKMLKCVRIAFIQVSVENVLQSRKVQDAQKIFLSLLKDLFFFL